MAGEELDKQDPVAKEAKAAVVDSTPNEHEVAGMKNYNNENYATDNQYGQDLSGIKYKEGISEHFGGDGSIGENDIKRMMDAGYSSDDVYNFSKKKGLNYNQHGQKYMKGQGSYEIGKGSDQWGDVFGSKGDGEYKPAVEPDKVIVGDPKVDLVPDDGPLKRSTFMPTPGAGNQYVNQDNDVNSTVNGNDNTVTIGQNNAISNGPVNSRSSVFGGAEEGATNLMDNYVLNLRKQKNNV